MLLGLLRRIRKPWHILSPYDEHLAIVKNVQARLGGCPYMIVKDMNLGDEYDPMSSEDLRRILPTLSKEDVEACRIIMMPKPRDDEMENMRKLVLGPQHDDYVLSFTTTYSYQVVNSFTVFKNRYSKAKGPDKKINMLLGFTSALDELDVWLYDQEYDWSE